MGQWYSQSVNAGDTFDYSHGSNDFHPLFLHIEL
jgi:hypothetical protein